MLEPGAVLQDRYVVDRSIGRGGMGAVYLALDQRLGSRVALKETFFSDDHLRKAFEREARLLASLRHPALPRVSDHFAEAEGQFLVMEYIAGDDLEQMLAARACGFAPAEVLTWADQLLDGLDYLHTQQPPIIHRDIKPQNLKLTDRGQIILLDFGLAKGAASGMTQVSGASSILGYTPGYAPLEQIQGAGTDARADLYSLAATLYRLLTNTAPPDALKRATTVLDGASEPLIPASEINPQVSVPVAMVLHGAMSLKRSDRPATATEMRNALRKASEASPISTRVLDASVTTPAGSSFEAETQVAGAPARPDADAQTRLVGGAPRPGSTMRVVSSPGAAGADRLGRNRKLGLWAIVAAVVLVAAGALFLMRSPASGPTASSNTNENTNSTAGAAANAATANLNSAPPAVNPATANANQAAALTDSEPGDGSYNDNDNSRPRTVGKGKKGAKAGVSGTVKKHFKKLRDKMRY